MSTHDPVNEPRLHANEPHREGVAQRLNWLRAGVLGANDGIVSVAAIVVGVAGATTATALYQAKGLSLGTARQVARELTAHDALAAHLSAELNIDEGDVVSPWHAAIASAAAFTIGAILPLLAILLPPEQWRVPVTSVAVLLALALTGTVSAQVGGSSRRRATARVVIGGALALAATYGVGALLGASGVV
jgi:VIT1/CCC1 family predicted Fe2+/Mn2+ transporter